MISLSLIQIVILTTFNMDTANLKSPLAIFYQWEKEQANNLFMRQPYEGKNIDFTWKETGQEIRKMAQYLINQNLPAGSKIGLVSKNCAWWVMCDLAIMMAGHVSVPIYPNVNATTLNYVLTHSQAKFLFVGKLDDWASMADGVPAEVTCISFPKYAPKEYTQWEEICKITPALSSNPDRDLDQIMTIIYTSGTTGKPKGVVHRFHALAYAITAAQTVIHAGGKEARMFSYLPLAHIAERMLIEIGAIYEGGTIFFAESLDTFAKNLADTKPTVFLGVPRIWTKFQMGILSKLSQPKLSMLLSLPIISGIIKKKIKTGLGLNDCNHYFTGAAPTPPALMKWYKKLGINLQEVYGMTENTAYSHFNRKGKERFGSAGQAMPNVDVRIEENGEILVKSDCLMVEYYKEPELTDNAFRDGFLRTGDEGYVDENGYLYITGRVKDIFKTEKGKYVSPSPIEMKFAKNSLLEQICVVGNNLPQPIALVVLSEEAKKLSKEELSMSLSETLTEINPSLEKHEKLKKVVVVKEEWTIENSLLTPTMKIKRNPIEKLYNSRYVKWYEMKDAVVWES